MQHVFAVDEKRNLRELRIEKARRLAVGDTVTWCRAYRPHIRLQGGGTEPFTPYAFQKAYMRELDAGGPLIVNKARQIGLSTCTMIVVARELCERPGWTVLAISRKRETAQELVRIARLAYMTAQRPGKPEVTVDNRQEFGLANGARLIAETASEEAGRTYTASRLVFDEFAFLPWQEEMWRSAQPTIEASGNVVVISTPNGDGDSFEALWSSHTAADSEERVGEVSRDGTYWRCFRFPWWVHPSRDEEWKTAQLDSMTVRDFRQEYECSFEASGANVFSREAIRQALDLWSLVVERLGRTPARVTGGCDVAGEGRDETVAVELEASALPFGTCGLRAWERVSGPELQSYLTARYERTGVEWAIDYTGVGYGIAQNLSIPHRRVTFTAGSDVTGDDHHQRIPRAMLLSNAVQMLEHRMVALDPNERELLRAVQTARWEKRHGEFVDRLDAWLLALWMARDGREETEIITIDDVIPGYQEYQLGAARL